MTRPGAATKQELRRQALACRDVIPPDVRAAKSEAIAGRVMAMPQWQGAGAVLGYLSFRSEVETRSLLAAALCAGKRLALPRVNRQERRLELYWVGGLEAPWVAPGTWGIGEPVPEKCQPADPDGVDVVLVPGVAFDTHGRRIGYGGGYYDRLLSEVGHDLRENAIALAFEEQIWEEVPAGEADFRVPIIVTDQRIIVTGA
ncbi:MAG: 5-formyltetrahydrofolate cyclo-ligase [Armatimonadetes bacterium]|nr:5-formyltetrahydrofolate cyclo-ligase [Armatimonadota bacterium]